jgi:hypothetical protein
MRFLKLLVAAPLGALVIVFAFANRELVTIYFDPTGGRVIAPVQAREYVVLLIAAAAGVVAGGAATWIGQGRHRRAAREAEAEVARLRNELQTQRFSPPPSLTRQA